MLEHAIETGRGGVYLSSLSYGIARTKSGEDQAA
jgi:hypothetical protein